MFWGLVLRGYGFFIVIFEVGDLGLGLFIRNVR